MSEINVNTNTQSRHLGLDCLRMAAMFFVVVLHVLGHGGVLSATPWMSHQYMVSWFMEITAYCAVDAFAMLSGYVGVQSGYSFKLSRLVRFWLRVVFYSLSITILFLIFKPETLVSPALPLIFKVKAWIWIGIKALFPLTTQQYWYATSYAAVCMFMPLMNVAIDKLEKKQFEIFLMLVLIFFCCIPCVLQHRGAYYLNDGYSAIWLCVLYLLGGYMRRYNIPAKITRRKAVFLFALSTTLIWGNKILIENQCHQL